LFCDFKSTYKCAFTRCLIISKGLVQYFYIMYTVMQAVECCVVKCVCVHSLSFIFTIVVLSNASSTIFVLKRCLHHCCASQTYFIHHFKFKRYYTNSTPFKLTLNIIQLFSEWLQDHVLQTISVNGCETTIFCSEYESHLSSLAILVRFVITVSFVCCCCWNY
jgi:hypothetical protein